MVTGNNKKEQLYRFVLLVKSLYLNHKSHCPYSLDIPTLDYEDQLLLAELVHSLTVLNQSSYTQSPHTSTQIEYLNALHLLLPAALRLTPKIITAHEQLRNIYNNHLFSYIEAGSRLKLSTKTIKRYIKPLEIYGLAKCHHNLSNKVLIEVLPNPTAQEKPDMFETMQGEWKEFVGFVEF